VRESAVAFGGGRVLGVLTEPGDEHRDGPCLVVLNAGLIYRVGPGRLSVEIARCAASAGFSAFRFDLSGLGDAAPRAPPPGVVESAVADVKEALDHLGANHGFRSFVLLGLCSGAIHAHHATVADDRIEGAVLLDGYSYPTLRSGLGAAADRLRSPVRLLRSLVRRAVRTATRAPRWPPGGEDDAFLPPTPSRQEAEADLRAMVSRGVQLLYIFSGEWNHVYRHEGQIRAAFPRVPFGATLTERLIPSAEHLFFTPPERARLLGILADWLMGRFPGESKPVENQEYRGKA
jgi:hypothetical protein